MNLAAAQGAVGLTREEIVQLERNAFTVAWLADDEVLEVTPENLRLRKRVLEANKRSIIRTPKEEDED